MAVTELEPAANSFAEQTGKRKINKSVLPVPPNEKFAEQSVLGSILIDSSYFEQIAGMLKPEDFYYERHALIFEAMLGLYSDHQPVDVLTLKVALERKGNLEPSGGVEYLVNIVEEIPDITNIQYYAKIVIDCSLMRQLIKCSQKIQNMVLKNEHEKVEKILSDSQQLIYELGTKFQRGNELVLVKEPAHEAFTHIEELYNNPDKSSMTGIPTGFYDLDNMTSGLQRSDLVVIAGRPSMGKTALAMNIAENAAIMHSFKVAIFSLEMPALQLSMRTLSSLSGIDSKKIREGTLGDGEEGQANWRRLSGALNQLSEAPIYIDATPGVSPLEISARSRRMKREIGLDMVIVDYLQLLQTGGNEANRATELANITRELKFLAKELDVPIIALSQLNREVEKRPNKRPLMSDLRESGAIEQDADVIIFIYRDDMYDSESREANTAELVIAKHRNGETGKVMLAFVKNCTRFDSLSTSAGPEGDFHA